MWIVLVLLLLLLLLWQRLLHVLGLGRILLHRSLVHHLWRATDSEWLVLLRCREDEPSMEILALVSWGVLG